LGVLKENGGKPGLLKFGQPLMLDPAPDDYQRGDPELSDRWIMLLDWTHPNPLIDPPRALGTVRGTQ